MHTQKFEILVPQTGKRPRHQILFMLVVIQPLKHTGASDEISVNRGTEKRYQSERFCHSGR